MHKLYIQPQARYSEDIDLVQIKPEPISGILDRLRIVFKFLGRPTIKQKANNNTMIFKFNAEFPPHLPIRLKIETNCREHFSIMDYIKKDFEVKSRWFSGKCTTTTYHLDELMGTKLRAPYQRKKGRDLFDIYYALVNQNIDIQNVILCYRRYMDFVVNNPPSQKEFLINMEEKMTNEKFLGDITSLLRPEIKYNPQEAYVIG